jgi:monothiol glutaredoxin
LARQPVYQKGCAAPTSKTGWSFALKNPIVAPIVRGQTAFSATKSEVTVAMDVMDRIKQAVETQPIVLFMKGTPQFPMCGFSSRTVQALKAVGAEFHSVNVLEDPEIRANLPRYSNWPTFPQLFINGELIGGCDITLELYEKGDLQQLVTEVSRA